MLDDEINKRITEAANRYHPAYDDEAWTGMALLLDEHLPLKKGRRRILFFLLFSCIICAGLFFIFYPHEKNSSSSFLSHTISKNIQQADNKKAGLSASAPTKIIGDNKQDAPASPLDENVISQKQKPVTSRFTAVSANQNPISKNRNSNESITLNTSETGKTNTEIAIAETSRLNNTDKSSATSEKSNDNITQEPATKKIINKISTTNDQDSTKSKQKIEQQNLKEVKSSNKQTKTDKSFAGNFGISLSTGADVSGLSVSKAGKLTVAYGAGLSYNLSRRFTLHTGFYINKKLYSVGKNDYHAQRGNIVNYNYLQSIDADCKVYEIPLVLNYNFGNVKNHSWFAAAGLSSYLMKKESYDYYYKYPSGNTYDKFWSVSNKNKHYFSVLDLSAGYEYTLNKRFSFAAEPYLKLPFSGVGAGKIKLNSAGFLFTVTMKPFKK